MPNLKGIRTRIGSVKSTQKITRAKKMVAGARLNRAQQQITAIRPYAVSTSKVLSEVVALGTDGGESDHPLLARRPERTTMLVVVSSDRGLCGSFNSSINKAAEREWKERVENGQEVKIVTIGRKARDYFRRRRAPVHHVFEGVWDKVDGEQARSIARTILQPFRAGEVDSIYIVYNEFKSAMSQVVSVEPLFPIARSVEIAQKGQDAVAPTEFIYEPSKDALLERLIPMYVEITILRALYESLASELGARMTAMDAATKNANEMISRLTLQYNRLRQAAITTEILEIIGGAEALKG